MKAFIKKIKSFGNLQIIILAALIIIPATRSLYRQEFFHMHDFTHVARLAEMDRAISDGHFPVRWSQNFGFGYGMPLFNFYGPLPFYIAWLFLVVGFSFVASIKLLIILNFFISFISMYYLTRYFWGKYGALLSATAFIYVPYRALNTFVRGSLNELTSMTFISLSLFFTLMMMRKKKIKWMIFTAISLAGIVLSHNITALMAFPVILIYGLLLASKYQKKTRKKKIFRVFTAFILSVGLSAFYAIPSFFEKSYTAISDITSGYFHYSQHFLYLRQLISSPWGYGGSIFGLEDGLSFQIGKLHIVLASIGVLSLLSMGRRKKLTRATIISSCIFIVISIFMTTFKTQFIWDNIALLQYVQFPWRFLSLIAVFSSILVGGSIKMLRGRKKLFTIPISIGIIISFIFLNYSFFQPKDYLDDNQALYYSDVDRIQKEMSVTLPDYRHPNSPAILIPPESRFQIVSEGEPIMVDPIISRTHEFLVKLDLDKKTTFTANIFDFPGWELYANNNRVDYYLGDDLPVLKIDLDPDIYGDSVYISGVFKETPIRKIADYVTIITLLIISYVLVHERHSRSAS